MKQFLLTTLACVLAITSSISQTPQSFKYQAVARDINGDVLVNQNIGIRINILEGTAAGPSVYLEIHSVNTNQLGLFSINIGMGTTGDDFSTINWGMNSYFIKTEMDPAGGSAYVLMGISQLLSVPYALYSENTANVDDADADPNNEMQSITKAGSTISLSDGGGSVNDDVDDADNNPTNEIQTLGQTGTDVTLSNGGGTVSVADKDNDATNELQTISKIGSTVVLSDGGGSITDEIDDADNDPYNEYQTLSLAGNNLGISKGNVVVLPTGVTEIDDLSDGKTSTTSVFLGKGAGAVDDGTENKSVALGDSALTKSTNTPNSTAIGWRSMKNTTDGSNNTAVGSSTLVYNTKGNFNTVMGSFAMHINDTGSHNAAFGSNALRFNMSGNMNTSIGNRSSYSNREGSGNTNIGHAANIHNRFGSNNTIVGTLAGASSLFHSKSGNVFIGYEAGRFDTTDNNDKQRAILPLYNNVRFLHRHIPHCSANS